MKYTIVWNGLNPIFPKLNQGWHSAPVTEMGARREYIEELQATLRAFAGEVQEIRAIIKKMEERT